MNKVTLQDMQNTVDKIDATQLLTAFDRYAGRIKVLSLDCFDTLLWRKTALPGDVFFMLQQRAVFQELGLTASLRAAAEAKARAMSVLNKGTSEVNLSEIYLELFPHLSQAQVDALIEEELLAELEMCYAFPPMINLIRAAHQRGIKVIIVSDTYLNEQQLKRLLAHALPADIFAMLDKIFCSSDYGYSKSNELFKLVLPALNCNSGEVLHLGDNFIADYVTPRAFKINALHFIPCNEAAAELFRLQDTAAKILDPTVRNTKPLTHPFRGVFSLHPFLTDNPEKIIGYATLGPVMYAFARFLAEEIANLQATEKNLKVVFLMRDAYLPWLACKELQGESLGKRIRISRFASYAASFRSLKDIDDYLIEIGSSNRFQDIAHQLLLPDQVAGPIIRAAQNSANPVPEFIRLVRRKDIVEIIINRSNEYRERLFRHLENKIDLKSGDTLLFIDLGYSGTAQRRLTPMFNDHNIKVLGRYLMALRVPEWDKSRRGLMDPSWCDDKMVQTIVFYVTLLEQLCTSNEKSVVDYDALGNAIYSNVSMSEQQHLRLQKIQKECVRFVQDAKNFLAETGIDIPINMLRETALASLGRMVFLSTAAELNYLQQFEAELNLGTNDILRVFDPAQGLAGLRRRGMFYMEKPSKDTRTNYPAELRVAGLELVLSLIVQHRFGLDLKLQDMVLRRLFLPILFERNTETYQTQVEAYATHDGFFAVWLPTGNQVSILVGENYEWLQLESAEIIKMESFVRQAETHQSEDARSLLSFSEMNEKKCGLFECQSVASKIIYRPSSRLNTAQAVLRLVFRPIAERSKEFRPNNQLKKMQAVF